MSVNISYNCECGLRYIFHLSEGRAMKRLFLKARDYPFEEEENAEIEFKGMKALAEKNGRIIVKGDILEAFQCSCGECVDLDKQTEQFEFFDRKGGKVKIGYVPIGVMVIDRNAFERHLKKAIDLLEAEETWVENGDLYKKEGKMILEAYENCLLKCLARKTIAMPAGVYEIGI